jgi:enterochelin esterase family protein
MHTAQRLTVPEFEARLASNPTGASAQTLAEETKAWFGKSLQTGGMKVDETTIVWAIESTTTPTFFTDGPRVNLRRIEGSNIYAAVSHYKNGDGILYRFNVAKTADGKPLPTGFIDVYNTPEDDKPNADVPHGELKHMPDWQSHIFEGTSHEWYVYTPAGLQPGEIPAVMVFQDGQWAKNYMPDVLDNLIAKKEIPKMVAVFVAPGVFADKRSNRSFEYDTLSDQYCRFITQEILPEVEKTTPVSHDPAMRAIAGLSSGGIAAFTAAWEHPEQFGKVMSWIGSFTDIAHGQSLKEGGQNYPPMIRMTPKKPIRVFLQDGANDLDNQFGNWPLANQEMAKALAFAGYDYKFVFGMGNHSDRHGRAILPDTMRWLWRN